MQKTKTPRTVGYINGQNGSLNTATFPFYRLDLPHEAVRSLLSLLDGAAATERAWFTITATKENLNRLRIMEGRTPAFEMAARGEYVRGDILRVSGQNSINVDFCSLSAAILAQRIRAALDRMQQFMQFRVHSRKHNVVTFIPDTELKSPDVNDDEHERMGLVGAQLAAEAWPQEDFSDWEAAGV